MKSPWTTVVIAVLSLFVLLVAIGQAFFARGERLSTEVAYSYDHEVNVPFDGVYMRDESLVFDSGTGVLSFENPDGTKVGKSSVIARRYKTESDSAYLREIEALKKQIEVLDSAEKLIGTDSSQLEAISMQINESHSDIISAVQSGDYALAGAKQNSLLEAMCKREITLKDSQGYSDKKSQLNREVERLRALMSGSVQDVTAGNAGYFVSSVDGYEGLIGYSDISKMTEEKISEIVENPKKNDGSTAIGKLIADYHWRVAAVLDDEYMLGTSVGDTVELRVGSDGHKFEAEVVSKERGSDGKVVCVFQCDRMNSVVVSGRTARFKLVISSYGGLRVPRKALRYNDDNERGVFVQRGQTLAFKKVDVIYWSDDYVICKQNVLKKDPNGSSETAGDEEIDDDYLKLYDIIVTEGKELYDGKFIG